MRILPDTVLGGRGAGVASAVSPTRVDQPGVGSWVANPDGTVTFTPVAGFHGSATLGYAASDTVDATVSGSMAVRVTAAAPATSPTTTTAMAAELARTGTDPSAAVGLALSLLLAGAGCLLVARRRQGTPA